MTNLNFGVWVQVFGDARMITALLDRVTDHWEIQEMGSDSCLFKESRAAKKRRAKNRQ